VSRRHAQGRRGARVLRGVTTSSRAGLHAWGVAHIHMYYVFVYVCMHVCVTYVCMLGICICLSLLLSRALSLALSLTHKHTSMVSVCRGACPCARLRGAGCGVRRVRVLKLASRADTGQRCCCARGHPHCVGLGARIYECVHLSAVCVCVCARQVCSGVRVCVSLSRAPTPLQDKAMCPCFAHTRSWCGASRNRCR
jgi:hypothetical protein